MSYVENNLLPNEQVTYWAKLHWIIYFWPIVFLLGAVALAVAVAALGWHDGWMAATVLAGIALLCFLPPWIDSLSSEFAVTNKRVLIKVGLIRRHSLELLLQKVEGIGVDQTLTGRILGYGTITVTGTGGTRESFQRISRPLEFRRQVQGSLAA
jgi:prepilin signal peptidase PulO-like enzyme (type II secretory pathway)